MGATKTDDPPKWEDNFFKLTIPSMGTTEYSIATVEAVLKQVEKMKHFPPTLARSVLPKFESAVKLNGKDVYDYFESL